MTNPELNPPARKTLWVSETAHAAVTAMQVKLSQRFGYRVTQSEAIGRGMAALEREQANGE